MAEIRITPPAVLAVDLALVKSNMGIDGGDLDALVTSWTKGVIADLEHEIGQCMMEQTWRVTADGFGDAITLPHPVIEIASVKYIDPDGVEQTLADTGYRVRREQYQSSLLPARGASWPATLDDVDVVTIEVVCGYGDTPDSTPENVQLYILAKMREQFDPATRLERDTVQSTYLDGLLDACRSYA
ncbi:hypothetical protein ASC94_10100 [Massilia sp. Root418]|uniref:head-tail connector protein n=1 Tax=Massilia sp. Root418 TaxID=1736532 RepID=UPI0006FEB365|nr:hypothetical protein [Massilia sp. Root418]KQW97133.1 hypothetical protein ASC94_10100 [Massilia sp. Root418]